MTDTTTNWLQTHSDALRRLASHLLQDPNEVDDALQECYVQALRSPPRERDGARAWLEAVLRNVIRKRSRSTKRRLLREEERARPELEAATIDVVARQQSLEALTSALASLPEREKKVIFLRYFDGLPAREISRALDKPVEQIYRDLDRARLHLRQRLEHERTNWRAALTGLVGLRPQAAVNPLTLGSTTMLMQKNILYLIGAAAVAMIATTYWPESPKPSTDGIPLAAATDTSETRSATVGSTGELPSKRDELPTPESDPVPPSPYVYELDIHLRTAQDLPARYGLAMLAPRNFPLNIAQAGKDGRLHLKWRGRTPSLELVYTSPQASLGERRLQRLQLAAGRASEIVLRTHGQFSPPMEKGVAFIEDVTSELYSKMATSQTPALVIDKEGFATFLALEHTDQELEEIEEEIVIDVEENSTASVRELPPQPGSIEGLVYDAKGKPMSEVFVFASRTVDDAWQYRTFTDAKGRYQFKEVAPGHYYLRAGGGDHGIARTELDCANNDKHRWEPTLDRGLELKARLVDAKGKALAGWRIEITSHDPSWIDGARTDDTGMFAVPNLKNLAHKADIYPPNAAIPAWSTRDLWPQNTTLELRVPLSAMERGTVVVTPTSEGSRDWPLGPVFVFAGTRFGEKQTYPERKGFTFEQLPAGSYEVNALGDGFGFGKPEQLTVIPGESITHATDLGKPSSFEFSNAQEPGPRGLASSVVMVPIRYLHPKIVSGTSYIYQTTFVVPGSYLVGDRRGAELVELTPNQATIDLSEGISSKEK